MYPSCIKSKENYLDDKEKLNKTRKESFPEHLQKVHPAPSIIMCASIDTTPEKRYRDPGKSSVISSSKTFHRAERAG